jgi:hypothetical protein
MLMTNESPNFSANLPSDFAAVRAKQLYELLKLANAAHTALREQIDDDVDTCEDDENHPLHSHSSNAHRVLRAVENTIIKELHHDSTGLLRSEFEKLAMVDVLKNNQSSIKHILKTTKPTPQQP